MAGDGVAAIRRRTIEIGSRKLWLVAAFVVVFLTFGVPRWLLTGDAAPDASHAPAAFTQLCRQHGGTPATAPAAGGGGGAPQQFCTVKYGATTYRMDAITANGFDADTASFQRQGCEQAQSNVTGGQRFVYHRTTGVCEHRP
jgi:hypothetical protein